VPQIKIFPPKSSKEPTSPKIFILSGEEFPRRGDKNIPQKTPQKKKILGGVFFSPAERVLLADPNTTLACFLIPKKVVVSQTPS